jgi:cell division protein FtsQ
MPVTVSADKRFLRAHLRPVRRHGWWRVAAHAGRAALALVVVGVAVFGGGGLLLNASVLRIDRITVRGIERLSRGEVLALVGDLPGTSILRADLDQARRRLMDSPWVADAVLRRRLPASVDIVITERRPIGIGRLNGDLFLVDDGGHVIDEFRPKYAEFDLPIVDGLAGPKGAIDPRRVELASQVIASISARPDIARHVSQIDVSDVTDAVVLLDNDSTLLRLGDRQFLERLQSYLELAPRLREAAATIDYVDLRYGLKVFVGTGATAQK